MKFKDVLDNLSFKTSEVIILDKVRNLLASKEEMLQKGIIKVVNGNFIL